MEDESDLLAELRLLKTHLANLEAGLAALREAIARLEKRIADYPPPKP
jgi:hypothetical protein